MTREVTTIVGAIAGFVLTGGNPIGALKGAAIGGAIGGLLFPDKINRVIPGLQDKKVNAGDYGYSIPFGYGTFKSNAWMLWGQDLYEQSITTSEGGGFFEGPEVTTTVYNTFFRGAFLVCEGPVTAISKIWIDDVLKFDISSVNTGAIVPGSKFTYRGTITPTLVYQGATWKFYLGSEEQAPDPMMESYLGVGNVPAYRGLCYVTVDNLFLDPYGKRLPNITFEVVKDGNIASIVSSEFLLDRYQGDTFANLGIPEGGDIYLPTTGNVVCVEQTTTLGTGATDGLQFQCIDPSSFNTLYIQTWPTISYAVSPMVIHDDSGYIWIRVYRTVSELGLMDAATGNVIRYIDIGTEATSFALSAMGLAYASWRDEIWTTYGSSIYVLDRTALLYGSTFAQATLYTIPNAWPSDQAHVRLYPIPHRHWILSRRSNSQNDFRIYDEFGSTFTTDFEIGNPTDPIYALKIDSTNDCIWAVTNGNTLRKFSLASFTEEFNVFLGLTTHLIDLTDSGEVLCYKASTKMIQALAADGQVNWEIEVAAQVNAHGGFAPLELRWLPAHQKVLARYYETAVYIYRPIRVIGSGALNSDIVKDIATRVAINHDDLEVDTLTDTVPGYSIDVRTQARACIDPLRSAFPFDLVGEDGKIRAKKRGQSSVMTISYGDLVLDESTNARPYDISHADHIDVASAVDVIYSDTALNYERSVQRAKRHTVASREITQMVLPIAISGDVARRAGEVALYSAWVARDQWTLNAARKHWELNVGDAFTFIDEVGTSRRMLCTKRELLGLTRLRIEAVLDDATVYTSTVTGAGAWTPPIISVTLQKRLELLDIPILKDSDDFPGFYAIGTVGTSSASLYESIDNGITYSLLGTLQEAALGYSTTALGNFSNGNVWDTTNVVRVVVDAGELVSVTDAQVLAGLNAALIGKEIIQYATATLVSTGTYDLSRLLRGRRGTEWAISLHTSGEKFIPLPGGMNRINSSARNALRYYKAVKAGDSLTDATALAFSNTQIGLKPFSPTYIQGARDGSSNLTITWLRRSRIGSAWGTVIDMPLGEDTESYQIDIMQGSTVKRTINATSTTAAYSATDQTTDFGSPQASILVNLYQISATVGRGTVGIATI